MKRPQIKKVADEPSWIVRNGNVELALSQLGGHMAPVRFYLHGPGKPLQPYYVSPWQGEKLKIDEPVLAPLRGDFFCMPFGANAPARGKAHKVHGEPAGSRWRLVGTEQDGDVLSLTTSMITQVMPGQITKKLMLVEGHNVVYSQHVLEGYSGRAPLGHHATLDLSEQRTESVLVSTSKFEIGRTAPTPLGQPGGPVGEYQSLAIDEPFSDLKRVPLIWKHIPYGDCTSFPTRKGFTDVLGVFKRPGSTPAWTTAVFSSRGFLWFSLKDPSVLPATVFWMANAGRHGPPWNGRNCCIGLEDVCAFFAEGIGPSNSQNVINRAGIATTMPLGKTKPKVVNYIQGVQKVPPGFGRVKTVRFSPGKVTFVSQGGKEASAEVSHEFLATGLL